MAGKIVASVMIFICSFAFLQAQDTDLSQPLDSLPKSPNTGNKITKIVGIALPSAMVTYGLISLGDNKVREWDYDIQTKIAGSNPSYHTGVDDYLRFAPAVLAFGLKLGKVQSKHKLSDMCILYALSNAVAGGAVLCTKEIVGRERPDGSDDASFPSGHTAVAFVSAEFLYQEYKDKSVWISVAGYTMASATGILRIYNNRHWFSDVVTGASIGILSTKLVYWSYPYLQRVFCKKGEKLQTFIVPAYNNKTVSLSLSHSF